MSPPEQSKSLVDTKYATNLYQQHSTSKSQSNEGAPANALISGTTEIARIEGSASPNPNNYMRRPVTDITAIISGSVTAELDTMRCHLNESKEF